MMIISGLMIMNQLQDELDCPICTGDNDTTPLLRPPSVEPTFLVVELPIPAVHHQGANAQNMAPKSTNRGGIEHMKKTAQELINFI